MSRILLQLLVLLVFGAAGCRAPVDDEYLRYAQMAYEGSTTDTLAEGDAFELRVYQEEAMSGEYTVTGAGEIQFPLVGRVVVKDRDCDAIAADIASRLADGYIVNPVVTCRLIALNSQKVVVSGEVESPGLYPFRANLSLVEAIALAGGLGQDADQGRVVVTRIIDGAPNEIIVPFKQILRGRTPNFLLWPGDSVFVPTFRLIP